MNDMKKSEALNSQCCSCLSDNKARHSSSDFFKELICSALCPPFSGPSLRSRNTSVACIQIRDMRAMATSISSSPASRSDANFLQSSSSVDDQGMMLSDLNVIDTLCSLDMNLTLGSKEDELT
jgi:hypothetical protein